MKSLEELKSLDLKGYCYYVSAWGMSMTSRHSYQPELWIVLEDNGTECVVSEFGKEFWKKTLTKDRAAYAIADYPAICGDTYTNLVKQLK